MKVFAHQQEYNEMLLLSLTRVQANTYTTQCLQKWARGDSEGHRDDTYNQSETTPSQRNSVIAVICLSLPQDRMLRLEHVNRANRMRAKRAQRGGLHLPAFGKDGLKRSPSLIRMIVS